MPNELHLTTRLEDTELYKTKTLYVIQPRNCGYPLFFYHLEYAQLYYRRHFANPDDDKTSCLYALDVDCLRLIPFDFSEGIPEEESWEKVEVVGIAAHTIEKWGLANGDEENKSYIQRFVGVKLIVSTFGMLDTSVNVWDNTGIDLLAPMRYGESIEELTRWMRREEKRSRPKRKYTIPGTKGRTITVDAEGETRTYELAEDIHGTERGEQSLRADLLLADATEEDKLTHDIWFFAEWRFRSRRQMLAWDASDLQQHLSWLDYYDDRPGHKYSGYYPPSYHPNNP